MSSVELLCERSFSDVEGEIIDMFIDFQNALIESDLDRLNEILSDDFEATQIPAKPKSKSDFISSIDEGALEVSKCEIFEPAILFDGEDSSSLIGKIRLTAKVNGRELRWISNTVAGFEKVDGKLCFIKWEY